MSSATTFVLGTSRGSRWLALGLIAAVAVTVHLLILLVSVLIELRRKGRDDGTKASEPAVYYAGSSPMAHPHRRVLGGTSTSPRHPAASSPRSRSGCLATLREALLGERSEDNIADPMPVGAGLWRKAVRTAQFPLILLMAARFVFQGLVLESLRLLTPDPHQTPGDVAMGVVGCVVLLLEVVVEVSAAIAARRDVRRTQPSNLFVPYRLALSSLPPALRGIVIPAGFWYSRHPLAASMSTALKSFVPWSAVVGVLWQPVQMISVALLVAFRPHEPTACKAAFVVVATVFFIGAVVCVAARGHRRVWEQLCTSLLGFLLISARGHRHSRSVRIGWHLGHHDHFHSREHHLLGMRAVCLAARGIGQRATDEAYDDDDDDAPPSNLCCQPARGRQPPMMMGIGCHRVSGGSGVNYGIASDGDDDDGASSDVTGRTCAISGLA